MAAGSCARIADLPPAVRAILDSARRGVLSTIDRRGGVHSVPVCFAVDDDEIITPVDHKPKRGRKLARVQNVEANPRATLLIDRWDEDWTRLGWVMIRGRARLEEPGERARVLVGRYDQYRDQPPPTGLIVVRPEHVAWWTWA